MDHRAEILDLRTARNVLRKTSGQMVESNVEVDPAAGSTDSNKRRIEPIKRNTDLDYNRRSEPSVKDFLIRAAPQEGAEKQAPKTGKFSEQTVAYRK